MMMHTEKAGKEMKKLHKLLCSAKNGIPCGHCSVRLNNPEFLKLISLRFLIGLIRIIMDSTLDSETSICKDHCYIRCDGSLHIKCNDYVSSSKLNTDISICKYMILCWAEIDEVDSCTANRIQDLVNILDDSTHIPGIVISLRILYENYNMWTPPKYY